MKPLSFLLLFLSAVWSSESVAQNVAINTDGSTANPSSLLDVKSTSKGVLIPRMNSVQRNAIASPAEGLMVYDSDKKAFMYWDGSKWQLLVPGNSSLGVQKEVTAPAVENTDRFGYKLTMKGNYAAIASFTKSGSPRVFIYEKSAGGNWEQKQKLTDPEPGTSGYFGSSLDIDGDYLVVGDPYKFTSTNKQAGKVYVYHRTYGAWSHEATIERTTAPGYEKFGWDVAISTTTPQGAVVAVGVPQAQGLLSTQTRAGKVMLYKKTGTSWQHAQTIAIPDFQANDQTGYAVDIEGDLLVFGAPYRSNNAGRIYIYKYAAANNTWVSDHRSSGGAESVALGYAVSISAGVVAAGAPRLSNDQDQGGYVLLLYRNSSESWTSQTIFTPTGFYEAFGVPHFGADVQLDGLNLLIGAPGVMKDANGHPVSGYQAGRIALYKLQFVANHSFLITSLRQEMQAEYSFREDKFGSAVGLSGNSFVISNERYSTSTNFYIGAVQFGSLD